MAETTNRTQALSTPVAAPARYEAQSGGINTLAYEPVNLDEAFKMASLLVASGLTPKAIDTPQKAFLVMAQGRELGLSTMQALNNIYVVEGRVSLSSDLMAALILKSPVCEYLRCTEMSPERATYVAKRKGGAEFKFSFTWEDAKRAGLASRATYQNNPGDMLRHRALSKAARAVFPDVVSGLYTRDEAEDAVVEVPTHAVATEQAGLTGLALTGVTTTNVLAVAPAQPVEATTPAVATKVRRRAISALANPEPSTPVTAPVADALEQSSEAERDEAAPHRAVDGSIIDPISGEVLTSASEQAVFAQVGDAGTEEALVAAQALVVEVKPSMDPTRFTSLRWLYFWSRHRVTGRAAPADAQNLKAIN